MNKSIFLAPNVSLGLTGNIHLHVLHCTHENTHSFYHLLKDHYKNITGSRYYIGESVVLWLVSSVSDNDALLLYTAATNGKDR